MSVARPKMIPRGASERAPPLVLPDFLDAADEVGGDDVEAGVEVGRLGRGVSRRRALFVGRGVGGVL